MGAPVAGPAGLDRREDAGLLALPAGSSPQGKLAHRGDNLASELLEDAHEAHPEDLSYREVESVIYGLSFAGHEAVTALLGNCLLSLPAFHRDTVGGRLRRPGRDPDVRWRR